MKPEHAQGPKYWLDIEGTIHPWTGPTITTEEIAELGGWDVSLGVIEIDADNNERTLQPGEVVELKPGHGFAKKVHWKRGYDATPRIHEEVELLRRHYAAVEFVAGGNWIKIPDFPLPSGWSRTSTDVILQVPVGYAGTPPYGIYVPGGLSFEGVTPKQYTEPASNAPPFPGVWGVFSWTPKKGLWRPGATTAEGTNLLDFVRSCRDRFAEGA